SGVFSVRGAVFELKSVVFDAKSPVFRLRACSSLAMIPSTCERPTVSMSIFAPPTRNPDSAPYCLLRTTMARQSRTAATALDTERKDDMTTRQKTNKATRALSFTVDHGRHHA